MDGIGKERRMSAYKAGALSGILLVASVWFTGKFFGASAAFVNTVAMVERFFMPEHLTRTEYFLKEPIAIDWQWMFVIGIFLGSLIASSSHNEFSFRTVPDMWAKRFGKNSIKRSIAAFFGGVLVMFGARLAGGSLTGHGLSGIMQLSVSGVMAFCFFFLGGIFMASLLYRGVSAHEQ